MTLGRRGFLAGLLSTPAVALAIKATEPKKEPRPTLTFDKPAPWARPFPKWPTGDVAQHAAVCIGILAAGECLCASDRQFITRQMQISGNWDQLLKDLMPAYGLHIKVGDRFTMNGVYQSNSSA